MPRINIRNFAINSRCYDANNNKTLYSQSLFKNTNANNVISKMADINLTNVNADTALGQSWFH